MKRAPSSTAACDASPSGSTSPPSWAACPEDDTSSCSNGGTTGCGLQPSCRLDVKRRRTEEEVLDSPSGCPDAWSGGINRRILGVLCKESLVDLILHIGRHSSDVPPAIDLWLESCAQCRRLMVRNLNFATETPEFMRLFASFGPIEDSTIVRDKETKKSKGYGFVTFKHLASVRAALQAPPLVLHGRCLHVKLAASSAMRDPDRHGDDDPKRKLFVRNLSDATTTETLRRIFQQEGDIEDCVAVIDHATGKGKGYGFVTFMHASAAARAMRTPQRVIDNQMVFLSYAIDHRDQQQQLGSLCYQPAALDAAEQHVAGASSFFYLPTTTAAGTPSFGISPILLPRCPVPYDALGAEADRSHGASRKRATQSE